MLTFQQIILLLQSYWESQGCILLQPYDMEIGAATSHPATFLKAIDPNPWKAAYTQASRRPRDGRYAKNPNRLQHYYQYQVILKPAPQNVLELYLDSLKVLGLNLQQNDVRFVEDNWENPTLGAWGLGWEIWLNGMEITQFTYFQQVGGLNCYPVLSEITYGLERLSMYLQKSNTVYDLIWTKWHENNLTHYLTYGDIFFKNEIEQSQYNFEYSNINLLFKLFDHHELEAKRLIENKLIIPSYEMILKATHIFNLLDARGIISITKRTHYISRIRKLSCKVAHVFRNLC